MKKIFPPNVTIVVIAIVLLLIGKMLHFSYLAPAQPAAQTYLNKQYGFSIALPDSWGGYTILNSQWAGSDVATGVVVERGPITTLRHPLWTSATPREDMPIMVFTKAQWVSAEQDKISFGSAPFGPSMLGQNSKYILALPARYNYDFKTGWEEVDQLVHTLKAFEPK